MTPKDVAEYMVTQMGEGHWLYQETIVYRIRNDCGPEFVYNNASGNLAIDKAVLREFKKLTENTLVWERGSKAWRRRRGHDKPGREQE